MKSYTASQLVEILQAAEKTFCKYSSLGQLQCKSALSKYKEKINTQEWTDDDFFLRMVFIVFYSGFRAQTVTAKGSGIKQIFTNCEKVAKFNEEKIQKIIDSKKVIGHRLKIQGIIYNAKQTKEIKNEFGSFRKYIDHFGNPDEDETLCIIAEDLQKRFKYLGGITVFHFLKEIGFETLKPDRVLCRIFSRLGFVDSVKDNFGVINAGHKIASANNIPIRYIDTLFVEYGQVGEKNEFGLKSGICLEVNPQCNICGMYSVCRYKKKTKIK